MIKEGNISNGIAGIMSNVDVDLKMTRLGNRFAICNFLMSNSNYDAAYFLCVQLLLVLDLIKFQVNNQKFTRDL